MHRPVIIALAKQRSEFCPSHVPYIYKEYQVNPDQFKLLKLVVGSIVSLSAANVARNVIENNISNPRSIQVKITTLVVGDIVFTYIWKDVDTRMDQLRDWLVALKKSVDQGNNNDPITE